MAPVPNHIDQNRSATGSDTHANRRGRQHATWRCGGAIVTALAGIGFFFVIIGVFGLPAAIIGLAVFVALALMIFQRAQAGGTEP